ncbi:hypothetical protein [Curtobacterium herbarum]|uniref:DUF4333 domain-containing protein n=1 Tax=Curtobacterium herbarum TaxID=150122 RepID=A0ABP4JYW3_9MICO|nr:hypothetical protein [Curtobacterium herbarum]MBM7476046.1 hypothetical protein [Curtobacterium herbarum]MCS6544386.1 hypothetical protein [Curtobacterium herbarum]
MSDTPDQQPSSSAAGGPDPERHEGDATPAPQYPAQAPQDAAAPAPEYPAQQPPPQQPPQYPAGQAPQFPGQAPQFPSQAPQVPGQAPQFPAQPGQYGAQQPQQPPQYGAQQPPQFGGQPPQDPAGPGGQQPWQGAGAPMVQPGGAAAYGGRPQPHRGRRVLVAVVGIVAFLVAGALVRWGLSSFGGPSKQELVDEGVKKITEQTTFPKQVDSITTWTGVDAEDDAIHYRYSVAADPTAISERAIRSSVLSNLCSTPATRDILEEDIAMRYSYVFTGSDKTVDLEFTDADC